MNLQIRDPRARDAARRLAELRGTTMTEAVVTALQHELARAEAEEEEDIVASVRRLTAGFRSKMKPGGRDMTKDEIDEMWGHEPDEPR